MDSDSDRDNIALGAEPESDNDPSSEEEAEEPFGAEEHYLYNRLQRVRNNDPDVTNLNILGHYDSIRNIENEGWEDIGRDLSNNTQLEELFLLNDALQHDEKASSLFRGWTRSSSICNLYMNENGLSVEGVSSMVPFLQNANKLRWLNLSYNNIRAEGFNILMRALRDSPIEILFCSGCDIDGMEIDIDYYSPKELTCLHLSDNSIGENGCRELAKLLHGEDAILEDLGLRQSDIDDNCVAILVDALRNNTSLEVICLVQNEQISKMGRIMILKLLHDVSSIESTLRSNHTLLNFEVYIKRSALEMEEKDIAQHVKMALRINGRNRSNPGAAGRKKLTEIQLHCEERAALSRIQGGVSQSLYSQIDPLILPEVLSLVGCGRYEMKDLHVALKSSIVDLLSTVSRKKYVQQQLDEYTATSETLHNELDQIKAKERGALNIASGEHNMDSAKRGCGLAEDDSRKDDASVAKEECLMDLSNRRKYIEEQLAYNSVKLEEMRAALTELDAAESESGAMSNNANAHIKRRRVNY